MHGYYVGTVGVLKSMSAVAWDTMRKLYQNTSCLQDKIFCLKCKLVWIIKFWGIKRADYVAAKQRGF